MDPLTIVVLLLFAAMVVAWVVLPGRPGTHEQVVEGAAPLPSGRSKLGRPGMRGGFKRKGR